MAERRREQRWPTYFGGRISFANRLSTADCLVRDRSTRGARLVVHNGAFVPDEFDLAIPCKSTEMRVRARWRQFDVIGVEVVAQETVEPPIPLAWARRVRDLEAQNATLRRRFEDEEA